MRISPLAVCAVALVAVIAAVAIAPARAQTPPAFECDGGPNTLPFATDAPVLLRNVTNGRLYSVGGELVQPNVLIAQVWGSSYEMGFAHGQLLAAEIKETLPGFMSYMGSQLAPVLKSLPVWLQRLIESKGVEAALDVTWMLVEAYTPQSFKDELQGTADGAGVSVGDVIRVSMIPSLIQAACSIAYASGEATVDGGLYSVRALDWGTDSNLNRYPVLHVRLPSDPAMHPFASLSWPGFVGVMAGVSTGVAVQEKVMIHNATYSRSGTPWHYMLQDISQRANSVTEAIEWLQNANRTCSIYVGLGDVKSDPQWSILEYTYKYVNVYNETNPFPGLDWTVPGFAYVDKHTQPDHGAQAGCMPGVAREFHGQLNAETLVRQVVAREQTGDMFSLIYDFQRQVALISNASPGNATTPAVPAYLRNFVQVDVGSLFEMPAGASFATA